MSLIFDFGLFCFGHIGSNFGPDKFSLISGLLGISLWISSCTLLIMFFFNLSWYYQVSMAYYIIVYSWSVSHFFIGSLCSWTIIPPISSDFPMNIVKMGSCGVSDFKHWKGNMSVSTQGNISSSKSLLISSFFFFHYRISTLIKRQHWLLSSFLRIQYQNQKLFS